MIEKTVYRDAMHYTERLELSCATADDISAVMGKFANQPPIWEVAETDIEQISSFLELEGWPHARKNVLHSEDGSWRYFREIDDWKDGEKLSMGASFIRLSNEPLSECRLAAECALSAIAFLEAYKNGKLDSAVSQCATYVNRRCTLLARHSFLRKVERGKKVKEGASDGGIARRRQTKPATSQVLDEMKKLVAQGQTVSNAASIAAKKGIGTSKGANQRLWSRNKSK